MSLTPEQLRDYRNWHELTAKQVHNAVKEIDGGWATVFNQGVPCWASRLRNFFNITPKFLKRYDSEKEWRVYHARLVNNGLMAWHALHGAVYQDKGNRDWLQMATAAAVYHYQGEVTIGKEVGAYLKPQMMMPIFKLVAPDGTGGSREVILTNPKGWVFGDSTVADCETWTYVRNRVVLKETYAGSYNYAETITRGYDAHKAADVKTHREWPGFYINPDPDSKSDKRCFPERDGRGALLHLMVEYKQQAEITSPKRTNIIPRGLAASHLKPVANPDDPKSWKEASKR